MNRDSRTSEVAAAVGLSAASIQAYARDGRIPFRYTPGRQYRFNVDEVRQILAPAPLIRRTRPIPSVAGRRAVIGPLTGYLPDRITPDIDRRQRIRGMHEEAKPARATNLDATGGGAELGALIAHAGSAAVAVLHR